MVQIEREALTTTGLTGRQVFDQIQDLVEDHENFRSHCLNLIASENVVSPEALRMLATDFANRYTVGPERPWFPGLEHYTPLETYAKDLVTELLPGTGPDCVTVQPLSGMMANMVAYHAMINRGDQVLVVKEKHGGHFSHRPGGEGKVEVAKAKTLLDMYGAHVSYLPFDPYAYNVDTQHIQEVIDKMKPRVIIVGTSEMLFPAPLRELRAAAGEDTQILYDASHVFGLILGGEFQQPLLEGADMVAASTNKTLGAPDHGVVAWTEQAEEKYGYRAWVSRALVPLFTSNDHGHEIVALATTLAEMKDFGSEYAQQVIANAQALGRALHERGLTIVAADYGYTNSHEVLIDIGHDSGEAMRDLEAANIIVSRCPIPTADITDDTGEPNTGLRLGTNELTRLGMKEREMEYVADFIAEVLLKENPNGSGPIGERVASFRDFYQDQQYCF